MPNTTNKRPLAKELRRSLQSEDYFKKDFTKRSYRNLHKQFSHFIHAPKIEFADIVGLVEVLITQYFYNLVVY